MDQLNNKNIVITGGANGIGYNIADKYLSEGAKTVIILDNNEKQGNVAVEALNNTHKGGEAIFIPCDVTTDIETIGDKIIDTFKTIDVLINSAGIADARVPKKLININTTAVVEWSFKFYEHMRTDKGGSGGTIVNIASLFGYKIAALVPVYCASKFAVVGFTRSLGHGDNFEKTGVRVVALCPGFTETTLTKPLLGDNKNLSQELIEFAKSFPWQSVDVVGDAAVDVFKTADSGTAWLIEGGKPIEELPYIVPKNIKTV